MVSDFVQASLSSDLTKRIFQIYLMMNLRDAQARQDLKYQNKGWEVWAFKTFNQTLIFGVDPPTE